MCDLFTLNDYIELGNYTDDTDPFVLGETFDQIVSELEGYMPSISEWFSHDSLKANAAKKFHLFLSPFIGKTMIIQDFVIKLCNAEVLLGIIIHSNISFSVRVFYLCATAYRKLHALSRVSKYISSKKASYT